MMLCQEQRAAMLSQRGAAALSPDTFITQMEVQRAARNGKISKSAEIILTPQGVNIE